MPIMIILELFLAKRIWNQKIKFRNTISEIWLHKNGEEVEIVYLNKLFVVFNYSEKFEEGVRFKILLDTIVHTYG